MFKPHIIKNIALLSRSDLKNMRIEAFKDYKRIFNNWPYSGGKKNIMSFNAQFAMPFISIYKCSQMTEENFKKALHSIFNSNLIIKLTSKKSFDLKSYYDLLRKGSIWSIENNKKYPHTFLYNMTQSPY